MKLGILVRALSIAAALVLLSASARMIVPPWLMLRQGQELQLNREYSKALDIYTRLAALRPDWLEPHFLMGQIYAAQGRWPQANSELSVARQLDPADARPLCELGRVALHQGDENKAANLWTEALYLNRFNTEARFGLARLHLEASRFGLAEAELRRIALLERQNQEANYLLGLIVALDSPASATEYLRTAVQGENRDLCRKAQEVLSVLTEASTPGGGEARRAGRLAAIYLQQGHSSLALRQLEKLLADEPGNHRARAYLGYALLSTGDSRRALETLRSVTQADPKNPLGHYFLGLLHRSQGYLPTALWDFKRSLRRDPSNPAPYAETADTLRRMGRYSAAAEWYEAACAVAPEEPGFWLLLAQFHVDVVPNAEEGLLAASKAASLSPSDPLAQDLLGWALYFAGDLAGAKGALERAVKMDPEFARAHYHLGVVFSELGDKDGASWAYQRAIDLDQEGEYRAKASQELRGNAAEG